ncbi:hypothetical protein LO772_02625 [Yinghuangia sp. ASG 101]|uniref:hypothetical protein n=1 Tax=Yinghuangia sp. ASG 101 TaxID=2896848 RepID=UPI001E65598E|nr:hypothetical protein [Yinghuangia sp. ASG 101]UGQ12529.1 hypothetical protein LO772_02625 [Yinghuangia sp. ASG 101]
MPHPVLALGLAAVTAAGGVWYVPALGDLRAGDDRPLSRRLRARACVTGWGTGAALAVVLLVVDTWPPPAATAGLGIAVTAVLGHEAAAQRTREEREDAAWRPPAPGPTGAPTPDARRTVAAWVLSGVAAATTAAVALTPVLGAARGSAVALATVAAVLLAAVLLAAAVRGQARRHHRKPR